jgi:DNA-binding NarL/FixJ family response regulator
VEANVNQEHHRLSPGEEAVLALMARAKPIGDIAAELGLPVQQAQRLADGALETLLTYRSHNDAAMEGLDERHVRVLEQLALGRTNKEIERALNHRPGYVKKLIEEVFTALGVHNRTEAANRYNAWRTWRGPGS